MSDIGKQRAESEARHGAGRTLHPTRYGEAINRYLGAVGYPESSAGRPQPAAEPARRPTGVVVAGVDETPTSYTAVDHAAIEAELRGWDLRLLHVQHLATDRDAGERPMERMTDRVRACSPGVVVTSRVAVGPAAPVLLSDGYNANLVVVGHRHSVVGRAFGLSVADRVAAHRMGPVLVVRVPGWPPGLDFGARPLVVGVDGSPASVQAVDFAITEAGVRGCEVILLEAAGEAATAAEHSEFRDGVLVHRRVVAGDPVARLIDVSQSAAAVVVGRRGPGGFAGSLLGSVSRSMVQRAHCPVFLVG
jgi:nucleotide-binding universal stress UspA family protein